VIALSVGRGWRELVELSDFSPEVQARIRAQMAREDAARSAPVGLFRNVDPQPLVRDVQTVAADVERDGRELLIRVPLRAWSLNEERSAHWSAGRARTRETRGYLAWALAGRDLPTFREPVEIEAQSYGVRFDAGNDLPTVKAAVDVLVDMGVLEDDRAEYVRRLILNAPVPGGEPALELRVRPVGGCMVCGHKAGKGAS